MNEKLSSENLLGRIDERTRLILVELRNLNGRVHEVEEAVSEQEGAKKTHLFWVKLLLGGGLVVVAAQWVYLLGGK